MPARSKGTVASVPAKVQTIVSGRSASHRCDDSSPGRARERRVTSVSASTMAGSSRSAGPELLGDLTQEAPPSGRADAAGGEPGELLFQLRPDEGAVQLLGGHRCGAR